MNQYFTNLALNQYPVERESDGNVQCRQHDRHVWGADCKLQTLQIANFAHSKLKIKNWKLQIENFAQELKLLSRGGSLCLKIGISLFRYSIQMQGCFSL